MLARTAPAIAAYLVLRVLFDLCGTEQPLWWGVPLLLSGAAVAAAGSLRSAQADTLHEVVSPSALLPLGMSMMAIGVALFARAVDLPSVASNALAAAWLALVAGVLGGLCCRRLPTWWNGVPGRAGSIGWAGSSTRCRQPRHAASSGCRRSPCCRPGLAFPRSGCCSSRCSPLRASSTRLCACSQSPSRPWLPRRWVSRCCLPCGCSAPRSSAARARRVRRSPRRREHRSGSCLRAWRHLPVSLAFCQVWRCCRRPDGRTQPRGRRCWSCARARRRRAIRPSESPRCWRHLHRHRACIAPPASVAARAGLERRLRGAAVMAAVRRPGHAVRPGVLQSAAAGAPLPGAADRRARPAAPVA